jgi:hypothetical protein
MACTTVGMSEWTERKGKGKERNEQRELLVDIQESPAPEWKPETTV